MSNTNQEPEISSFSNDNLTVTVSKYPNCIVKCDIDVNSPAVVAANAKALKNVGKEVSIPGFRKGRAPEKWIKEKYQSAVEKEALDVILNTAFQEVLELAELHVLKDGYFKRPTMHEVTEPNTARFTLEFEVRPLIPSVKPEELKLEEIVAEPVNAEQEEMAIHRIRLSQATFEPIAERGVEEGDFGRMDIEIIKPLAKKVTENEFFEMNDKTLPEWIFNGIKGLKPGESVEVESPEKSSETEAEPAIYKVTIQAVLKGLLPELDDEFAKKIGVESITTLKEKVKEELNRNSEEEASQKMSSQLENVLLEKYPFDLPQSLVDIEKKFICDEQMDRFRKEGYQESMIEANRAQLEDFAQEIAKKKLQMFFLSRKIVHEFDITPTEEDLTHELQHQLFLMNQGKSSLDLNVDRSKLRKQIEDFALDKKVKQFLISQATKV